MEDLKDWLTSEEVAAALGLSCRHTPRVWRWNKQHPNLKYTKFGRSVMYRAEDVQKFAETYKKHANKKYEKNKTETALGE